MQQQENEALANTIMMDKLRGSQQQQTTGALKVKNFNLTAARCMRDRETEREREKERDKK
jgi:hypothetical protein